MDVERFDFIVIGGGSAGYAGARTAREQSERVAIVDDAGELGGLCILRGCMPSKTVIYSAEVLHLAQRGALFGLEIPTARADMAALQARKVRMVDDFKSYRQEQLESDRFTLFRERARFIDTRTIELAPSGRRLTAKAFLIATGSVVNYPAIEGLDRVPVWTSDDILELDTLPESLIMLGGGIVACELAQYLRRMGTHVIQIQRSPHILREVSTAAAEVIETVFREEGIELHTDTTLQKIEETATGVRVTYLEGGAPRVAEAAHLCNALGRRSNVDGLGLNAGGITATPDGTVVVNSFQQSSNPIVYAAGDVTGPFEIVHLAIMQGEIAARHARGEEPASLDYENRTGVVFTDPQIASAGLPIDEAKAAGFAVIEASYPFDDHGKSILMEAKHGYVKAWADRTTGRLLGAECVGKDGGELIHAMAVAVSLRGDVRQLAKVHWYHPTLSEIWVYPLEELAEQIEA